MDLKGLSDFHVHTTFSDGKNTPEEMVRAAIENGMKSIGFSDHSYTFYDERYCMRKNEIDAYIETVNALKEKYAGKIEILCGIEQDMYSDCPTNRYDYVIGSVHYVNYGDEYPAIDASFKRADGLTCVHAAAAKYENGDLYAIAEKYFETVSQVVEKTSCDIIGHFDLILKFSESYELFDEKSSRYRDAAAAAADRLLKTGRLFEINMGAMARGIRTQPYPSDFLYNYIKEHGGKFILSSDAHETKNLCFNFDKYKDRV